MRSSRMPRPASFSTMRSLGIRNAEGSPARALTATLSRTLHEKVFARTVPEPSVPAMVTTYPFASSELHLPRDEHLERGMVGQIDVEGGHGDEAALDGGMVAVGILPPSRGLATDPVVAFSSWIDPLHDRLVVDAPPLSRQADPLNRSRRHVHAQERVARKTSLQGHGRDARRHPRPRGIIERGAVLGDGDGRHAEDGSFDCCRDRSAVSDI